MAWFCVLIFLFFSVFGKAVRGRWANLLTVFCGFFAITIFFANLRLYGIDKISDDACIIILIGMIAYFVGYIVVCGIHQGKTKYHFRYIGNISNSVIQEDNADEIRKKIVDLMLLFTIAYSAFRLYVLFTLLRLGYSYIQVRTIYFNSQTMFEGSPGSIYGRNRLDIYLYQPILLALIIIAALVFFANALNYNQKQKVKFVSSVFICTVITAISNGGREIIYYFVLIFIFCFFIVHKKRRGVKLNLSKRQKRTIWLVVIVAVIAMVIMTFRRSVNGENSLASLMKTIYLYFTGYLPHFSIRLDALRDTEYTYGYSFILGLVKLPAAFLHRVVGVPTSNAFLTAEALTSNLQVRVDIGGGNSFNAYVGPFYYFFADFGYISLVIESFVFGAICARCENKYELNSSYINLFAVLFCFYLIISSMVRWEMIHPKTAMIAYLIPLIFKRNRRPMYSS